MFASFTTQLAIAAVAGVWTHTVYFNRGEHHMYGFRYLKLAALSWSLGAALYYKLVPINTVSTAVYLSTALHTTYLVGIYSSLLICRLFLSPINAIPGPFSSRISSLAHSWRVRKGNGHIQLAKLHSQYGPIVRIGPGVVSIAHPDSVELVQGPATKCVKGPNYDVTLPWISLIITRDKTEHAVRRKVWNPAFSDKAIKGYDQRIRGYQDRLISKLAEKDGQPVNMTQWLLWYSFDVMGDMAFGKSYNMIETSKNHWAIDISEKGLKPMSLMLPVWFFRFCLEVPFLSKHWHAYFAFCRDSLLERMENTPDILDIMSFVLAAHKSKVSELSADDMNWLVGDAQLIISAGSDTSAENMTAIIYYLVKHPEHMEKLREELAPLWAERPALATGIAPEKLTPLNHLNGVINEALRLLPPVPTNLIRHTPPEGITIGGIYIPGGVDLWNTQYAMGRDENNFVYADRFIPERWYSSPELVKDPRVFVPFTIGPYSCIGKPLALMNIRSVIAKLVCNFDIGFAAGEDGSKVETEAVDHFILGLGPLNLSLKQRVT
ncbi:cytochrome p450 [Cladorrhinum sp. PSN332]|nr:cytochrome p450 [Cladorrhinum sp. PSN332]